MPFALERGVQELMSRFGYAKKFRPFALIFILVGVLGFLLFDRFMSFLAVVGLAALGWTLACENCGRLYLVNPLKFLFSGRGNERCGHCRHIN